MTIQACDRILIEVGAERRRQDQRAVNALLGGVAGKRVSDEALAAAYKETGNVHKAGALVGLSGSTVHERLVRLGITRQNPRWTDADDERLRLEYILFRDTGQLSVLASSMGRT